MEENNQAGGSSYKMNSESKCPFSGVLKYGWGTAAKQSAGVLKVIKTGGQISYN
jgi:catalase-peroxidase